MNFNKILKYILVLVISILINGIIVYGFWMISSEVMSFRRPYLYFLNPVNLLIIILSCYPLYVYFFTKKFNKSLNSIILVLISIIPLIGYICFIGFLMYVFS